MTIYVETDFLLALIEDTDWLKARAEAALDEYEVVTSSYAYLKVLLIRERYEFDHTKLIANMLELVPVGSETERQIVLKSANYVEDGLTAFDAFHAATAEIRGHPILGSDTAYEAVDPDRIPLEPDREE